MTAREKFHIGQRVRMTLVAPEFDSGRTMHSGVVIGFGRDGGSVRVQVDGRMQPNSYRLDFWEPEPDTGEAAPEEGETDD